VPKQAGLVGIRLPDTAPALAQDKPYYWTVALACNPSDRTEDLVVGGWIEHAQAECHLKATVSECHSSRKGISLCQARILV
jgi:hypothetical protein